MSMERNLDKAVLAVAFVREKMTVGAGNKIGDFFWSAGGSFLCVAATRSVEIAVPDGSPIPKWIQRAAAKAEHVGCGNCGEQAALAFVALCERWDAAPLDYMARTNRDHAFVVVGRAKTSAAGDYTTWGPEAVVCDPWDGKAYPATKIPTKAYGGAHPFGVDSWARID